MRRANTIGRRDAFTLVEMLVVIAIIGILAALLLPALTGGKKRAVRIVCETQLQQIGVAFQSFSHDHNSKFPMQVSADDGGVMDLLQSSSFTNGSDAIDYRLFQPLSSSLQTTKILVCPADTRTPALGFNLLQNSNVSYFVGINAQYDQPMSILAGDGNLAASTTLVHDPAGGRLTWNSKLHEYKGNVLFSDGHVEEWKDTANSLASSADILLPVLGGGGGGGGGHSGATAAGNGRPMSNGSSQGTSSNQLAGASAPPGPANASMQRAAQSQQPANSGGPAAGPGRAGSGAENLSSQSGGGQIDLAESNAVVEEISHTNIATNAVVVVVDSTSTMSPADRKVASVLRTFLAGTYFFILLLLLLYAAYRIQRWQKEVKRRREFKLKLEAMRERYSSKR